MKPKIEDGKIIIDQLLEWLQIPITDSTRDTSKRVAKMYLEVFSGVYEKKPRITTFEAPEGFVCVTNIFFTSFCEHHLLPFIGQCGVVYHSSGENVIGLSKIPRIVQFYAKRPQLQERLTYQIAEHMMNMKNLNPKGVYVQMSAEHSCMTMRGIKARDSVTNTAVMLGSIDKVEAEKLLVANTYFTK